MKSGWLAATGFALWLGFSGFAHSQDLVQTFRGDEIEDRSFNYDRQYFLNILSFDFDVAMEKSWDLSESGYRGTAGSLSSREIYLVQDLKFHRALDSYLGFKFNFFQNQDFDTRYIRTGFEPEIYLDPNWTLHFPLQLAPEKDDLDLGLGLSYHNERIHYVKLSYISQKTFFNSETLQNRRFDRNPGTVGFQGSLEPFDGLWLKWDLGYVMPLEWELNDLGFEFDFHRFYYNQVTQLALDAESDLFLVISGEQTAKTSKYSIATVQDDRLSRSAVKVRGEYRKRFGEEEFRAGLQYFGLRENDVFPNDPASVEFIRRREYTPFVGYKFKCWEKLFFNPVYFVGILNNQDKLPASPSDSENVQHPISKLNLGLVYDFSPRARLVIAPTIQFFGSTFYGGTNVQLSVTF